MARMIELSRQGVDGKFYYWGTYNADVKSELMALVQAVWEFGVHKENYRAIESGTKEGGNGCAD